MDRLGDLVCSLPMDQHPELQKKSISVEWLISKGLEPVMECSLPPRKFWSVDLKFSFSHLWNLVQKLKSAQFTHVILFYAPWWVACACWMAGIPQRYSPRSRWFQILFFNHTLKQKRSLSEKHEADYNWDLLHWSLTGEKTPIALSSEQSLEPYPQDKSSVLSLTQQSPALSSSSQKKSPALSSTEPTLAPQTPISTAPFLELKSDALLPASLPQEFIVLHPGMGGSALNWPTTSYLDLAQRLLALGKNVVITGTPGDQEWLAPLEKPLRSQPGVFWLVGQLNLKTLIAVLARSTATIAPSTGVLHLAASTGTKTIGIYSPIQVQTPIRWGPRGKKAIALTPVGIPCPAATTCLGARCQYFFCLEKITPEQIIETIFKHNFDDPK